MERLICIVLVAACITKVAHQGRKGKQADAGEARATLHTGQNTLKSDLTPEPCPLLYPLPDHRQLA